jgi:hypothetical protein
MRFRTPLAFLPFIAGALASNCGAAPSPSDSTSTRASALNTTQVDSAFSDANGWDQPPYYGTIKYVDLNNDGRSDVCGRGFAGIICALDDGTGNLTGLKLWSDSFGDGGGWNAPQYYETIAYPDLNADGLPDVCGRGSGGIYCALSTGTGFGTGTLWSSAFSDANWDQPEHYSTIRFADLNRDGKADVCGRGPSGMTCAISSGTTFGNATTWNSSFSDNAGWGSPEFYRTIRLADVSGDGRADVCGRGYLGVWCALSTGSSFTTQTLWAPDFSDVNGWTLPEYYSTIQYSDVNSDGYDDLCARGGSGFLCALSTGSSFGSPTVWDGLFSDYNGWNYPQYYSTIQVRGGALCGRGGDGLHCSFVNRFNPTAFTNPVFVSANESDAGGWDQPQYYSTIGLAPDLKIMERGSGGLLSTNAVSGVYSNAPSRLRVVPISNTAFSLTWTDNSSDENGFGIFMGGYPLGASLPVAEVLSVGPNVTSTTVDSAGGFSLLANTKYCLLVRAGKTTPGVAYDSAASNVACATTLPNPSQPPPPTTGNIIGTQTIDSVTPNCGTATYILDGRINSTVAGTSTLGAAPGLFRCNYMAQFLNIGTGAHTLCLSSQGLQACKSAPVTAGQNTFVSF